jgi:hypothetical protein
VLLAIARGHQHGADALRAQVQVLGHRGDLDRPGPRARPHLARQPRPVDEPVDVVEEAVHRRVRRGDVGGQVVPEPRSVTGDRLEPSDEPDTTGVEHAEVEVPRGARGVVAADELQRGLPAGGRGVGDVVDGPGQAPGHLEPPEDVHAAVAPRHPGVPADGEGDVPPGAVELVGDLHP